MAVSANNGHSWPGQAQLRANHMDDPALMVVQVKESNSRFLGVGLHLVELVTAISSAKSRERLA
jgi:hypothetical protein